MSTWQSLLDPPVLFFVLGLLAVFVRSNLRIPPSISKFLALYLLMAIGFKGGVSLSKSGIDQNVLIAALGGMLFAAAIPIWTFFILRKKIGVANAAAVGATYGSVSAVTFVTGITWLEGHNLNYGGHMIAVLALMEFPAIIMGVYMARKFSEKKSDHKKLNIKGLLHEALFNGSIYVLLGSLLVGWISGSQGANSLHSFVYDLFKGLLGFFLLDLGVAAGKQLRRLKEAGIKIILFAILAPLSHALLAYAWATATGMSPGDCFLLMILASSSSYIAVPAALKMTLPEASPGIYLAMSLGITFPLNITLGIPFYWMLASGGLGVF